MTDQPDPEFAAFNAARRLPAGERAAYLDEACAGAAPLRQRVEELLRASEEAGTFLQEPAPGAQRPADASASPNPPPHAAASAEKAGDRIGRYKLLQQIGEGGCGVVYMADQQEPVRRQVALKVIKLGMDTRSVIARFEAERQALALMDHPNIAKVLDAGATETGRPFFVMELVRGVKITDYCDQRNLSTRERLDLFIQVCQAVQHAHQKGVIHRDLKPSNILVTARDGVPVPKVIDFGIAKATSGQPLTDKTLFTAFAQFMGTPAYMSPEQAEMSELGIDTRSDIYSLGVLLYELLTGRTPFDAAELIRSGLDAMRRTIREEEPARPSTRLSTLIEGELSAVAKHRHIDAPKLIHLLRGDLDWIVMKSLEKDRARRYETANGLAMDVQRYLADEPVVACPPSSLYRFQKLVRRNKGLFAAAGAVSLMLVLGVVASTWQAVRAGRAEREQGRLRRQAEAEKKTAQTEAGKSQQVAGFLKKMLEGVGPSKALGRDTTMLREILDKTVQDVGTELTNQPEVEVEIRLTLGITYYELGLYQQMEAMDRQSLQLARTRLGPENESVANSLFELGRALIRLGRLEEAEKVTREALAMWKKMLGTEDRAVCPALNSLAVGLRNQGRLAEAETIHREVLALVRKRLGKEHLDVAQSLENLANVLAEEGKLPEAEALYRQALAMTRKFGGKQHPELAMLLMNVANVLNSQHKLPEAETMHREALAMKRKLLGNEHPDVATSLYDLGIVLGDEGKLPEAETVLREALSVIRKAPLIDSSVSTLGGVLHHLAEVLRQRKALTEARQLAMEAAAIYQRRHSGWPSDEEAHAFEVLTDVFTDLGDLAGLEALLRDGLEQERKVPGNEHPAVAARLGNLAMALAVQGRLDEAKTLYREALTLVRKTPANDPYQETSNLGVVLHHLAEVLRERKELTEARPLALEAAVLYQRHPGWRPNEREHALEVLTAVFTDLGDLAGLEAFHRDALEKQRKLFGNEHPDVITSLRDLASVLRTQGKLPEAETAQREALAIQRKLLGSGHPDVADSFRSLHRLLLDQSKLAEAETMLRDELSLLRPTAAKDPAQEKPSLGVVLHHLAHVLRRRKNLAEARPLALEAAAMYQRHPDWPKLEREHAVEVLTAVFTDLGDLEGLEVFLRDAIEKQRKLLGDTHPDLAASLHNLADVLSLQGKLTEAEALERNAAGRGSVPAMNALAWKLATSPDANARDGPGAIGFAEKAAAATNRKEPYILDTLAAAYAEARQFTNAVRVQNETMALVRNDEERQIYAARLRLYESNSPFRDLDLTAEMTLRLLVEGKFAEAEPLAREYLTVREKKLPDDWHAFNARSMLGNALLGQKNYAEAEPLLLAGYQGMEQRRASIHAEGIWHLKQALQRLVQLYEVTNRPDRTAEWRKKLAEFDQAKPARRVATPGP